MSDLCRDMKQVIVKEVVVGKKCDVCFTDIPPKHPYYEITTHHRDWGNDSVDSYEHHDACCPECAMKFAKKYMTDSWGWKNTQAIEIEHCNGWYLPKEVTDDA